jgi:hypothetical protein
VVTQHPAVPLRWRVALLLAGVFALLAGLAGGLARAGVPLPSPGSGAMLGESAALHAALVVCGFFGTVIGMERAVALGRRFAYLAPLASGAGALVLLGGPFTTGAWLLVGAASVLLVVSASIVRRQRAAHTVLLVVAALAWWIGNVAYATGLGAPSVHAWWFAFLVVTIAAERLEMTRLMRRRPAAQPLLIAIVAALIAGAALSARAGATGGVVYGVALALLGIWLMAFDIAVRTVRGHGLARYMAVCLLLGYAWLVVAGAAWVAMALGHAPARDVAFHALGLGFVVGMVMAHAPVILPALARIKLEFGGSFYVPLALLHVSLLLRLGLGPADPDWRTAGAAGNAIAIVAFAATVIVAARLWRANRRA